MSWSDEGRAHARCLSFVQGRFLAAVVVLLAVPPLLLFSGRADALTATAVLYGLLPALVAVELRRGQNLARAAAYGSVIASALMAAGVVGGLSPMVALIIATAHFVEVILLGTRRGMVAAAIALALACGGAAAAFAMGHATVQGSVGMDAVFILTLLAQAAAWVRLQWNAQRAATQHRQQSARRWSALASALDAFVTVHDRTGAVVDVIGPSAPISGMSAADLGGRGLFDRVHVADRPGFLKAIFEAADTSENRDMRLRLRIGADIDDSQPPVFEWYDLQAFPPAEGEGAIGLLRSAAASMAREADLDRAANEAQQAKAARAAFLSTVNHELRTPLNAIIGFSELMSSEHMAPVDPERAREYAKIINDAGYDLLRIISAMIDITRLDTGTYDFRPEPISLHSAVDAAVEAVRATPGNETFHINRRIDPAIAEVVADSRALRQILTQLFSNAAKFAGVDKPVEFEASLQAGVAQIRVRDRGCGIPADHVERLGEAFTRLHNGYDRQSGGIGLGLALVRRLVDLHRGQLLIESRVGNGTTMVVQWSPDALAAGDADNLVDITQFRKGAATGAPVPTEKVRRRA